MRIKTIVSMFGSAYRLIRPDHLLRISPFRGAYIFVYFQYKKFFEDPFWSLVRRQPQLFQNGDVLDVGANIGYTACVFAQAVKTGSKVFAFEPDQPSYAMLKEAVHQ